MIVKTFQNVRVPVIGLGTWPLRGNECRDAVLDALEIGYRHIDTAQSYKNEAAVGAAVVDSGLPRDEVFVTTKIDARNNAPALVRSSTEASLRRLGIEYIDLLLIHWPSTEIEPEATLDAMLDLQREGKIRHLGVSNYPPSYLRRAIAHAPILCNQVEYHPLLRQDDLLNICRDHDVMLTAFSPLAKGEVLQQKVLQNIGESYHKTPAQVALRWLIQQDNVAVVPKAASHEHRVQNFDINDFHLTGEEIKQIDRLPKDRRLLDPPWAINWDT